MHTQKTGFGGRFPRQIAHGNAAGPQPENKNKKTDTHQERNVIFGTSLSKSTAQTGIPAKQGVKEKISHEPFPRP
jgi:hypothetical protein